MELWYPRSELRRYTRDGGSMIGGPPRIVDHSTETARIPSYGDPKGNNRAPHFTVDRDGLVLQHQPINRAARALRNEAGGVQTNRMGKYCVQIERVGYAKEGDDIPAAQLLSMQLLHQWIFAQTGTKRYWRGKKGGGHCYGTNSPCRMSDYEWTNFSGICAHAEVPENSHWDVGSFRLSILFSAGSQYIGDDDMDVLLERGMRSNLVGYYQDALNSWARRVNEEFGDNLELIDFGENDRLKGIFGPQTENLVRVYQSHAGVTVDGKISGVLAGALGRYVILDLLESKGVVGEDPLDHAHSFNIADYSNVTSGILPN